MAWCQSNSLAFRRPWVLSPELQTSPVADGQTDHWCLNNSSLTIFSFLTTTFQSYVLFSNLGRHALLIQVQSYLLIPLLHSTARKLKTSLSLLLCRPQRPYTHQEASVGRNSVFHSSFTEMPKQNNVLSDSVS